MMFSCIGGPEISSRSGQYTLRLVSTSDTTDHQASLLVDTADVGSITITVTGALARNGRRQRTILYRQRDALFERKYFADDTSPMSDSLDLLVLAMHDTAYTYLFDGQRYMPLVPFGSEDYRLTIAPVGNLRWQSKRCNVHDTTYCTSLVFDQRFRLYAAEFLFGDRRYLFEY